MGLCRELLELMRKASRKRSEVSERAATYQSSAGRGKSEHGGPEWSTSGVAAEWRGGQRAWGGAGGEESERDAAWQVLAACVGGGLRRAGEPQGAGEEAAKWPGREARLAGPGHGKEALGPGEALPAAWPAFSG